MAMSPGGQKGLRVRKFHRRVLVVLLMLLLGAAAVSVPGGFASPAQRAAAAHRAAAAASFALDPALTEVKNPNANELTITPTVSGQAIDDHTGANGGAGNGGDWKVEYHWAVPTTLVPGKTAAIYLQIIVDSENPPQPNGYQMGALAPDFAQALPCQYPAQSSCSKTFEYPLHADQAGSSEIVVSIHMLSAEVDFHYRPAPSSTPPVAPPPPVVVPTPSAFDQTVTAAESAPGGTALITSPVLASAGAVTAPSEVTVDISGLSVRDQVIANARHSCYVNFTKSIFGLLKATVSDPNGYDKLDPFYDRDYHVAHLITLLTPELAGCLALVDALQQRLYATTAAVAGASCAVTSFTPLTSVSGKKARLRSVGLGDSHPAVRVSCSRQAGKLTITVASQSTHTPLSNIVGSRLRIGLLRSPKDTPGGQLSVAFHRP